MQFRVMTLNLEQDHKRWPVRRPLILDEIGQRKPDLMALNEVCVPLQTAVILPGSCDTDRDGLQAGSADARERAGNSRGRGVADPV